MRRSWPIAGGGGCRAKKNLSLTCFEKTKCSSSERFVLGGLWYFFMRLYKQSGRCQDVLDTPEYQVHPDIVKNAYTNTRKNTINLHEQVFMRMNTWLFETCQRQTCFNYQLDVQFLYSVIYVLH
jgi:hypothetical protein